MTDKQLEQLWLELQNAKSFNEVLQILRNAFEESRFELSGTGDRDE